MVNYTMNTAQNSKSKKSARDSETEIEPIIFVEETTHTIFEEANQNELFTYYRLGDPNRKRSQNSTLVKRLLELGQRQQIQEEEAPQLNQQFQMPIPYRFYNSQVKCRRCQKIGHKNYLCPEEFFCRFCLSFKHPPQKCPQKTICFNCSQTGHMSQQCCAPIFNYSCSNCLRKHKYGPCAFLTKNMRYQKKQITDGSYLSNHPSIICINCGENGHISCKQGGRQMECEQEELYLQWVPEEINENERDPVTYRQQLLQYECLIGKQEEKLPKINLTNIKQQNIKTPETDRSHATPKLTPALTPNSDNLKEMTLQENIASPKQRSK